MLTAGVCHDLLVAAFGARSGAPARTITVLPASAIGELVDVGSWRRCWFGHAARVVERSAQQHRDLGDEAGM